MANELVTPSAGNSLSGQVLTGNTPAARAQRMLENPLIRQVGVLIGIALSVALGVAVVLWSRTPSYSPVYANLSQKDLPQVVEALQQIGVPAKVDEMSGVITVPTAQVAQARMKIAGLGLPKDDSVGFELLQQEPSFATSNNLEAARFQRALEGELARSIATLANVESARVHLATPKQSVFARNRKVPSASVVLKLSAGRALAKGQVESVTHLVAASVPELTPERVTVVDQKGRLLSGDDRSSGLALSTAQLEYTHELEARYQQRIHDILIPLLGADRVRAEVTADLDFTFNEQTQERFNPDQPALRSEQTQEQQTKTGGADGVPGALTNQPPAAGTAPQEASGGGGDASKAPVNSSRNATRNYELDKTVSHTRTPMGALRRLSVAVVVDDRGPAGAGAASEPRTQEELTRLEGLVQEAIGYNAQRGDRVQVVNAAFHGSEEMAPLPDPPFYTSPWFWDLMRQLGAIILVLVLIFGVLRPTLKRLTSPVLPEGAAASGAAGAGEAAAPQTEEGLEGDLAAKLEAEAQGQFLGGGAAGHGGHPALPALAEMKKLAGPRSYEVTWEEARQLVRQDPKRVAQVVRRWITEDAG